MSRPWNPKSGPRLSAPDSSSALSRRGAALRALPGACRRTEPIGILGLIAIASLALAMPASAQLLIEPEETPPAVFPISGLELQYAAPHPDQPELSRLLPIQVELEETAEGWAAPRSGEPSSTITLGAPGGPIQRLSTSGLALVLRAIVGELHELGLYGIDVRPSEVDIDLVTEQDLRPEYRLALRLIITVGRVRKVRTIAAGDRVKGDWRIDHELHERIRSHSPLEPVELAKDGTTDLLDRRALEDYLHRLNRHPGRRVEAALAPAVEPGGIVLDYRVLESRPWYVYAQTTNTGTRRTNRWQTRVGAVHRQLTNRDDILSVEYLNAGGNDVNGIRARYEAPWFGRKRPAWMDRRKGESAWTSWLPREKIPWWGADRLRWEMDFGYGRFEAGRARSFGSSFDNVVVNEQTRFGGRFIYEAFQHRDFFIDLYGGFGIRNIVVDNRTGAGEGEQLFAIPVAGIHAERMNQISRLGVNFSVQGSAASTNDDEVQLLGRANADGEYVTLEWDFGYSTFLEPILFPEAWRDPESWLSSTLAHEFAVGFRGQYGFDYRLVPQATQIVGGLYSVRGYDQSIAAGDTVLIASFEYRFHVPRSLPVSREPLNLPLVGDFRATPQQVYGRPDWDLTLRAFVDVGQAIRNRNGSGGGIVEPDQTLVGAGLGAELQIRSNFRARIDWATALTDTSEQLSNQSEVGDQEIHVLFSILY